MLQEILSAQPCIQEIDPGRMGYATAGVHQNAVEHVIKVMREHLSEPLSLGDLADAACLSPYYFNRIFHRSIGLPPCEFLAALRLDAAKKLLLTTDLSVTDVCFAVGYNALGSFTSRFTQQVGLSPRHLRLRMRAITDFGRTLTYDQEEKMAFNRLPYSLSGRIITPGIFEGLIFVGAYPRPIPHGKPVSCTLLTAPGPFYLDPLPFGQYYLMAAAFSASHDSRITLIPDAACLVGIHGPITIQERGIWPSIELYLRPPRFTDPPILTALL